MNSNNTASFGYVGESNASINNVNIDVFNPNLAKFTTIQGSYIGVTYAGVCGGVHQVATAYTGFTLAVAGTMTGGTITVYGYRKA